MAGPSPLRLLTGADVLHRYPAEGTPFTLVNNYGPTECAVVSTWAVVPPRGASDCVVVEECGSVPIGKPVSNTRAYVLDRDLNLVPTGVPGSLFIAGVALSRGYHNDPALTAERFVPNPVATTPGERAYRTGDRARWLADGNLQFLGRDDSQIKLRGYRIELGEIEAALKTHERVRDAAVVARQDDGEQRLVAYIARRVSDSEREHARGSHVQQWQRLYDLLHERENVPGGDFDITGWMSSYTGQPIPAGEMRISMEETVARLKSFNPLRVLEIGCGTGLILTRLAPECESYVGLDFSARVLHQLRLSLSGRPESNRIELRQGIANDLSFLADSSVDLVVLNSVSQYFPDVEYLSQVLAEAIRVTREGGNIFVGDVRSLALRRPSTRLSSWRGRVLELLYRMFWRACGTASRTKMNLWSILDYS